MGATLSTVPPLSAYEGGGGESGEGGGGGESGEGSGGGGKVKLGLAGSHQELNAALGVRLLREWALKTPVPPPWAAAAEVELAAGRLPAAFRAGLAKTEWWGAAQITSIIQLNVSTFRGTC